VRLSKDNVIWVLNHLMELRQGEWPAMEVSYLERPLATRKRRGHAPFENPCLLVGEVESRLKACGPDGLWAKIYYSGLEGEEEIARAMSLPVRTVSKGIKSALSYISFKWPKDRNYKEWKRH